MDKDGYMVNGSGFYLLGYSIDSATGLTNSSSADAIQISSLLDNPVETTSVTYAANLPAGATAGAYTSTASTIQVYDALGNTHQMSLTWNKTGTNAWTCSVTVEDGLGAGTNYTASVDVTFNSATNIGTIASLATGAGYTVDASPAAGINFSLTFPGAGSQTIDLSFGTLNAASGVTQYASTGSSNTVSVASFQQNGLSAGSYSSISINSSGVVSINYTNGSTRQIFQIPIVRFNSPNNLQRVSGGAYQATLASGVANFYLAGLNGAGTVNSSSLEASNVDIATEFTTLIQSQQIYSANAKVVTTVNQMLNTIEQAVQ
jgi:flagellar hook protein FlgE